MTKRLIVLCDGTTNDAEDAGEQWSNVIRICLCVASNSPQCEQVVGYMRGMGTDQGNWQSTASNTAQKSLGYGKSSLDSTIVSEDERYLRIQMLKTTYLC